MKVQYIYDEKEIKTGVIVPIRLWEKIRGEMEKGKLVKEETFNPSEYRGIYKSLRVDLEGEIRRNRKMKILYNMCVF